MQVLRSRRKRSRFSEKESWRVRMVRREIVQVSRGYLYLLCIVTFGYPKELYIVRW